MRESYAKALRVCLIEEGGNDDDPRDHGGRTSRGITQREWDAWRSRNLRDRPLPQDVWQAPQAEIEAIYHEQYWQPYCDDIPQGLDLAFFDYSVNAGRTQAVRDLQRVLHMERADGMLGIATRARIAGTSDLTGLIRSYCEQRRVFYEHLRQYPVYGRGWEARVDHVEAAALNLAGLTHIDPAPHARLAKARVDALADSPDITVSAKANPADVKAPAVTPEQGFGVSTGSATLAGILHQFQDQLAPVAVYVPSLEYVLAGIAIAGVVLTVWGFWRGHQLRSAV